MWVGTGMADVWNRGSMLDRYSRLLFLSFGGLEALHVCEWVWKRPEASLLFHVACKPLAWGDGAADAGMHRHCAGESFTWYAIAECLPIDYSNYGDFSITCC